jgi:hypothetical protein
MIRLFKGLNPLILLVLVAIAILLRIGIFVNPPSKLDFALVEPYAAVLINFPAQNLLSIQENIIIALVIILIQAVLFNLVVNNYNLLGKSCYLPALMYVTTSSLLVPFMVLTPALLCNFLLIWMLDKFLSISRQESAQANMYDLGLMIAIGTLIYFPFIVMLILLWISLLIFRPFNWREWIAGLIGFATIYFFIGVAYYWTGSLSDLQNFKVPLATDFPRLFDIKMYDYLVIVPVLVILLLAVFALQQKLYRSYIHIRKSYLLLFFVLLLSLFSFVINAKHPIYHFLMVVPAVAVFMGFYFISATKAWFYESLYLVLAGTIIYFQLV